MNPLAETPIPPYSFHSDLFAYNARCIHCRMELAHSEALHLLQIATYPNAPIQDQPEDEVAETPSEYVPACKHCNRPCVHSSGVCALCLMGNYASPYTSDFLAAERRRSESGAL